MTGKLAVTARDRLTILQQARSIALVGISANPLRSSNFVATYLVKTPYTVYAVNAMYDEVLGVRCYPSLADLPGRRPVAPPVPLELALRYRRSDEALKASQFPGAEAVDAYTVRLTLPSALELLRALLFLI